MLFSRFSLTYEGTSESILPPKVSTQVQLASSCDYVVVRLPRALEEVFLTEPYYDSHEGGDANGDEEKRERQYCRPRDR